MNAQTHRYNRDGYAAAQMRNPRDTEYDAFSRVTHMLQASLKDPMRAAQAAQANCELWGVLASDLAEPENAHDDNLKAQLISLAIFSIRHGYKVMNGEAGAEALIEINTSIMRGLRGQVASK